MASPWMFDVVRTHQWTDPVVFSEREDGLPRLRQLGPLFRGDKYLRLLGVFAALAAVTNWTSYARNLRSRPPQHFNDLRLPEVEALAVLDRAGIPHVGGGKDLATARRPFVLEKDGYVRQALMLTPKSDPITIFCTRGLQS